MLGVVIIPIHICMEMIAMMMSCQDSGAAADGAGGFLDMFGDLHSSCVTTYLNTADIYNICIDVFMQLMVE